MKQPPAGQPAPSSASCAEFSEMFVAESVTQCIAKLIIVYSLSSWRRGWSLEQPSTKTDGQRKEDQGAWTTTSGGTWAEWKQVDVRSTWRSSRDLGAAPMDGIGSRTESPLCLPPMTIGRLLCGRTAGNRQLDLVEVVPWRSPSAVNPGTHSARHGEAAGGGGLSTL